MVNMGITSTPVLRPVSTSSQPLTTPSLSFTVMAVKHVQHRVGSSVFSIIYGTATRPRTSGCVFRSAWTAVRYIIQFQYLHVLTECTAPYDAKDALASTDIFVYIYSPRGLTQTCSTSV